MQPWHRWREPLAVALLVALALMLVVRGIALGLAYDAGNTGGYVGAIPGGDDLLLLTAAVAVLWCTTPVRDAGSAEQTPALSPHAWPIAVAGLVVVGLTVLGWFVLAVANVGTLVVVADTPTSGSCCSWSRDCSASRFRWPPWWRSCWPFVVPPRPARRQKTGHP